MKSTRSRDRRPRDAGTTYGEARPPAVHTSRSVRALVDCADRGEPAALVELGRLACEGLRAANGRVLVRRDRRRGVRLLERAVRLGAEDALLALADTLADGDRRARARAAALYRTAYRRGDATAAFNLACSYQNAGCYAEAVRWFRRAYEAGDPSAAMELARAELYGLGARRDVSAAFAKLERLARGPSHEWPANGDRIEAMLVMAEVLLTGWPVRRNHALGVRWLRRAASLGSEVARARVE